MPAKAGIQFEEVMKKNLKILHSETLLDSRFRGNDGFFFHYDTLSQGGGLALWSKFRYSTG
jgi:hypothetical protein